MTENCDMNEGDILPCPFCGNPPKVEMTGFHLGGRTIRCEADDCMGPHTTAACVNDAVTQWNKRTRTPAKKPAGCEPCSWPECGCQYSSTPAVMSAPAQPARESVIEECARVCDKHARWAEDKITEPPESPASQTFAATSLAADDCAAMIRALAAQPPAAPVDHLLQKAVFASGEMVQDHLPDCSAGSGAVPEREAFWLLEMVGHQKYALYTSQRGAFVHSWTEDVWQAGRFRDERDAHEAWRMLEKAERERWNPVEHMFINKVIRDEPQPVREPTDTDKVWGAAEACWASDAPRSAVNILYYEILRLNGGSVTGGDINEMAAPLRTAALSRPDREGDQ